MKGTVFEALRPNIFRVIRTFSGSTIKFAVHRDFFRRFNSFLIPFLEEGGA
jgi:hypothetical protein